MPRFPPRALSVTIRKLLVPARSMRPALSFTTFLISALLNGCASLTSEPPEQIVLPYVTNFSYSQPEDGMPSGWQQWTLSKFKKPTEYKLVKEDGRTVVRARASSSASGLVHPLN